MAGNRHKVRVTHMRAALRWRQQRAMPTTPPPKPFGDSLDFEIADCNEAERSLNELSAGLAQLQRLREGGDWSALRRKSFPTDRAMTSLAMDRVIALPPTLRPHTDCEQFPALSMRS